MNKSLLLNLILIASSIPCLNAQETIDPERVVILGGKQVIREDGTIMTLPFSVKYKDLEQFYKENEIRRLTQEAESVDEKVEDDEVESDFNLFEQITNAVNGNEAADLEKLGTEPVMPENEKFIRDLQHEMGLSEIGLKIRKMNDDAIALVGRENAFVVGSGHNYMFISEDWFNTLTHAEKRFLIGHELAHLMMDHSGKKNVANQAMAIAIDYMLTNIGNSAEVNSIAYYGIEYAKKIGFGTVRMLLLSLVSRSCEWEADRVSVEKLKSADGGIELFGRMQAKRSEDSASPFLKWIRKFMNCFASHPSLQERIVYLQQHQSKPKKLVAGRAPSVSNEEIKKVVSIRRKKK